MLWYLWEIFKIQFKISVKNLRVFKGIRLQSNRVFRNIERNLKSTLIFLKYEKKGIFLISFYL